MPLSVVADRLELLWGGWEKRLLGVQEEVCTCMYVRRVRAREQDGVRSDSRGGKATTSRRAKLSQSGNCNSPKRASSRACRQSPKPSE